jgi:dTMP kinase
MMIGKFIVIEGLEGAGKTTAIQTVSNVLNDHGIGDLVMTREPGGTPLAEQMRRLVKEGHPDESLTDMAELLLMYASRAQLVENVIRPALNQGQWVVGDRHDMSSQAYQGGGRGFDSKTMLALRQMVLGDFRPNLTLYMDIDPNIGLARARGRGELDRIEKQAIEFFERTRHRFLSLAKTEPNVVVIQANQSFEQVKMDIESALTVWLSKQ